MQSNSNSSSDGAYKTLRTGMNLIVDANKGKESFSMLDHNKKRSDAISWM